MAKTNKGWSRSEGTILMGLSWYDQHNKKNTLRIDIQGQAHYSLTKEAKHAKRS
jgi:hypothetical protein